MKIVFDDLASQRRAAGGFIVAVCWLMAPLTAVAGVASSSAGVWALTAAAVACALLATAAWKTGFATWGRTLSGMALIGQISLIVAAASNTYWQTDLHMTYYAALALLIVYNDRIVIVATAATITVQHLVLALVLPTAVFPESAGGARVALHAILVVVEAGALIWVVENLNNIFAALSRSLALERLTNENAERSAALALAEERLIVTTVSKAMIALARGDLTFRMVDALPGEYGKLRDDFNRTVAQLQQTIGAITKSADGLSEISATISRSAASLSHRTSNQVVAIEETASALHAINATVQETAGGAKQVADAASKANDDAKHSGAVMRDAVAAMHEIEQSSIKIARVTRVINDIAFQTNLLALNAAVAAARAGEDGRGFAVVAQEIRGLAHRSETAATEIKSLIDESSKQVHRGVRLVDDAGHALHDIVERITTIDCLISGIAASTREQAVDVDGISGTVQTMDISNQQNATMAEDTSSAARGLISEASLLLSLVNNFQIGSMPAAAAEAA